MSIDNRFWALFERTMGRKFERKNQEVASIEEWDSLTHVELIFELESEFLIQFGPQDVADTYSDTNHILSYLKREAVES